MRLQLQREGVDLGARRPGPDQHAVAARAVDLLHHQFVEPRERRLQGVGFAAAQRRHVVEQGLLAQVKTDRLRHVGVDRLVVGDAGAHRVGERDVAQLIGAQQTGDAEGGVGAEGQRVEEVVVDAAIDHVDALEALGGAHVDEIVAHDQVAPLHQLDAELVGQERVLVIGRVELAGRQHHDDRVGPRALRRDRAQRREQAVGVIVDRRDAVAGEQLGEQPDHHLAVLQHVGHAGRRAGVVLQHVKLVLAGAHDVDAGDVDVNAVGRPTPGHLRAESRVLVDHVCGDDAGLDDLGGAVEVGEQAVERGDALRQALFKHRPFRPGDDARQDVERDQALVGFLGAIDRERDADAAEHQFRLGLPRGQQRVGRRGEPARQLGVGRPGLARRLKHFVEWVQAKSPRCGKVTAAPQLRNGQQERGQAAD